jgi:hypothetical protein
MGCGAVAVLMVGWPELSGTARVMNPQILRQMAGEVRLQWLIILSTALLASGVTVALLSFRFPPPLSILVAVTIAALFIFSPLPIYLYHYREVPSGWHVSVSASQRYAAPLAILVAVLAFTLVGMVRRIVAAKAQPGPVA